MHALESQLTLLQVRAPETGPQELLQIKLSFRRHSSLESTSLAGVTIAKKLRRYVTVSLQYAHITVKDLVQLC